MSCGCLEGFLRVSGGYLWDRISKWYVGHLDISEGQVRTCQVRIGQFRIGQVMTGQVRTGLFRTGQVKIGQVRTFRTRL